MSQFYLEFEVSNAGKAALADIEVSVNVPAGHIGGPETTLASGSTPTSELEPRSLRAAAVVR